MDMTKHQCEWRGSGFNCQWQCLHTKAHKLNLYPSYYVQKVEHLNQCFSRCLFWHPPHLVLQPSSCLLPESLSQNSPVQDLENILFLYLIKKDFYFRWYENIWSCCNKSDHWSTWVSIVYYDWQQVFRVSSREGSFPIICYLQRSLYQEMLKTETETSE